MQHIFTCTFHEFFFPLSKIIIDEIQGSLITFLKLDQSDWTKAQTKFLDLVGNID